MTNQTIEQAVEESVEEFMSQYAWGKFFTIELEQEVRENLVQTLTEDRTALLTELRDCELLEEHKGFKGKMRKVDEYYVDGHNTLARDIKELISNMDSV